jgi:hypothetical protein
MIEGKSANNFPCSIALWQNSRGESQTFTRCVLSSATSPPIAYAQHSDTAWMPGIAFTCIYPRPFAGLRVARNSVGGHWHTQRKSAARLPVRDKLEHDGTSYDMPAQAHHGGVSGCRLTCTARAWDIRYVTKQSHACSGGGSPRVRARADSPPPNRKR